MWEHEKTAILKKPLAIRWFFVPTDVRQEQAHHDLVQLAIEKYGRLDVYVNNAGYSFWKPITEIDDAFLGDLLDTNLKVLFGAAKLLLV